MAMEDSEIIRLYFERDEGAIEATAQKYGAYCETIAVNILENREDAEECVNDAYLKTWNTIPPKRPAVLRTFLGKIVRNTAFDRYRRKNAGKRGAGEVSAVLEELEECVSGGTEPECELNRKELQAALNAFLETLPKEKCAMFVRRYWYSEPVAEIAKRYGMRENAVSVTLNRLRKSLREYLEERGLD